MSHFHRYLRNMYHNLPYSSSAPSFPSTTPADVCQSSTRFEWLKNTSLTSIRSSKHLLVRSKTTVSSSHDFPLSITDIIWSCHHSGILFILFDTDLCIVYLIFSEQFVSKHIWKKQWTIPLLCTALRSIMGSLSLDKYRFHYSMSQFVSYQGSSYIFYATNESGENRSNSILFHRTNFLKLNSTNMSFLENRALNSSHKCYEKLVKW